MKSIFTLFIVFVFILSTFSQSIINRQIEDCDKQFYEEIFDPIALQDCNNTHFGFPAHYQKDPWQNSLELKQSLDSVVSEYYDNGIWNKYYLSEYVYNTKGFNTQSIHHDLAEDESSLIPNYKSDFFFDESGNVSSLNHLRRDEFTGEWEYSHKSEYNYDADNNLVSYVLYGRNESDTDWIPFHRVEFDFDFDGKIIISRSYGWSELYDDWDYFAKEDYTYDENNYLVRRTSYTTIGIDEWRNTRKTEYVNDEDGNTVQRTSFKSLDGVDWVYYSKEELELNFSGLITKVMRADWVDSTNQWINDIRQDYSYDDYENINEYITFHWDTVSDDWLAVSKAELAYNFNFMHDDLLLPTSNPEFSISYNIMPLYKNMLTEVAYFSRVDTTWQLEDRETNYYSEKNISDIPEVNNDNIIIYPNPTTGIITITGIDSYKPIFIELFDLQGKHLLSQDLSGNNRVDLSHLKSGFYICKINQKGQAINQKILVR